MKIGVLQVLGVVEGRDAEEKDFHQIWKEASMEVWSPGLRGSGDVGCLVGSFFHMHKKQLSNYYLLLHKKQLSETR